MVGGDDERQHLFHRHAQAQQVGEPQPAVATGGDDAVHIAHAETGHAQQDFARGEVDVDGKLRAMAQRPREFRVEREVEVRRIGADDFADCEIVESQQPVGLVKPVLAHERRRPDGQQTRRLGDGAEAGIINAAQTVAGVEHVGALENIRVGGFIRAHEHLRALACGERRPLRRIGLLFVGKAFFDLPANVSHRFLRAGEVILRRESGQTGLRGQFDVDADAVGVASGPFDERGRGFRDGLEVDVAAKEIFLAQLAGNFDDQLHRVVRALDDAAAEEKPFDVVPFVEIERELHHFVRREAGALDVAAAAVDAVVAVVETGIGEQHFEQRDATPVRRVAVANARAARAVHAFAAARILPRGAAAGARGVILGVHWVSRDENTSQSSLRESRRESPSFPPRHPRPRPSCLHLVKREDFHIDMLCLIRLDMQTRRQGGLHLSWIDLPMREEQIAPPLMPHREASRVLSRGFALLVSGQGHLPSA